MKNLIYLIIFSIIIVSCSTPTVIQSYVLDYRPYTEEGMFISPNAYTGEHQPLGEINITVYPGKDMSTYDSYQSYQDPVYPKNYKINAEEANFTPEKLLDMCVQKAKQLGANGISNFKCEVVYSVIRSQYGTTSFIDHYNVYGLAIKRL